MKPRKSAGKSTHSHILFLLIAVLAVVSCAPKAVKKDLADKSGPGAKTDSPARDMAPTEASLRGSEFSSTTDLRPISFDYDSSSLNGPALETLKKNAEYLKAHRENDYLVAGYCDERGTIEYNLALGQRRAKQVRDYYLKLGVPADSVATISYGKENPLCAEATEPCWASSRRAETRLRLRAVSRNGVPKQGVQ